MIQQGAPAQRAAKLTIATGLRTTPTIEMSPPLPQKETKEGKSAINLSNLGKVCQI